MHSPSKLKCNLRALLPSSIPKWKLLLDIQVPVSGREAKAGSFISPLDSKQAHSGCATLTESFNLGSLPLILPFDHISIDLETLQTFK